jgi:cytochrome c oxidase subunit I+III
MPRRQWTYPSDVGWGSTNLIETLGSYLLAVGLILVFVNLAVSLRRGARVGNDPFDGATLEWAATSPPQPYNFAVIPTISSPYPMWDERDRRNDLRRVEEGELVLAEGHQTPASTVVDGHLDEVLDMPSDSPWPITIAGGLLLVFVFLLTGHWTTALVFAGAAAAVLVAWHATESDSQGKPRARPNGWWGMAIFLASETALFGSLIGTYFYLRFTSPEWPQGGIEAPAVALPIALTAALVASTLPLIAAVAAARRGHGRLAWTLTALAFLVQAGYITVQIVSYIGEKFPIDQNAYSSIYYTLLGLHHAHVIVGLLLSLWLLIRLARGLTHYSVVAMRAIALYWYAVAAIGVLVVATQVSPS